MVFPCLVFVPDVHPWSLQRLIGKCFLCSDYVNYNEYWPCFCVDLCPVSYFFILGWLCRVYRKGSCPSFHFSSVLCICFILFPFPSPVLSFPPPLPFIPSSLPSFYFKFQLSSLILFLGRMMSRALRIKRDLPGRRTVSQHDEAGATAFFLSLFLLFPSPFSLCVSVSVARGDKIFQKFVCNRNFGFPLHHMGGELRELYLGIQEIPISFIVFSSLSQH